MMLDRRTDVFNAKGTNRRVVVQMDGQMVISVRWLTWWLMGKRRREGRPRQVAFPLWAIQTGTLRPARAWWPGMLRLNVPAANDPWRRRTKRQRRKGTYPRPRPHRIRFTRKQQPAFMECATEIGVRS